MNYGLDCAMHGHELPLRTSAPRSSNTSLKAERERYLDSGTRHPMVGWIWPASLHVGLEVQLSQSSELVSGTSFR